MSNQSIDAAIAAAQAAAAQVPAQANAAMTGAATPATASVQTGAPLTFDDLALGSLDVNGWLKVSEFGLKVGNDNTLFDEIDVTIPMGEVAFCRAVRFGNPAKYERTYDGVSNVRGGSWAETIMRAQKIDAKASEFRSADIPFILNEALETKKGEVLAEVGDRLGHSISITGWKGFQAFLKSCQRAGMDIRDGYIRCTLGFEVKKNDSGTWGVLTFAEAREVPPSGRVPCGETRA